jgi:hypothetical protein
MTREHKRRIVDALQETDDIIKRALRYSPQFRDDGLILAMEAHRDKLVRMLEA